MYNKNYRLVQVTKVIDENNDVVAEFQQPILLAQEEHIKHQCGCNHTPAVVPVDPTPTDNPNTDTTGTPSSVQSSASDGAIGGDNLTHQTIPMQITIGFDLGNYPADTLHPRVNVRDTTTNEVLLSDYLTVPTDTPTVGETSFYTHEAIDKLYSVEFVNTPEGTTWQILENDVVATDWVDNKKQFSGDLPKLKFVNIS